MISILIRFHYYAGFAVGTAGSFPIFGLITRWLGWEWIFYFSAIVGVIWFWCWQQLVYDTPDKHPTISKKERTYINESLKEAVTNEKVS